MELELEYHILLKERIHKSKSFLLSVEKTCHDVHVGASAVDVIVEL